MCKMRYLKKGESVVGRDPMGNGDTRNTVGAWTAMKCVESETVVVLLFHNGGSNISSCQSSRNENGNTEREKDPEGGLRSNR